MSDQRLRELERRFRASGDAQDEAAWLAERLRVEPGLRERLGAAACVGHSAAQALVGAQVAPVHDQGLIWIDALAAQGRAPLVAASCAALRPLVVELEASLVPGARRPPDPSLLEALGVASLDELFTADGPVQAGVRTALAASALRDIRPQT